MHLGQKRKSFCPHPFFQFLRLSNSHGFCAEGPIGQCESPDKKGIRHLSVRLKDIDRLFTVDMKFLVKNALFFMDQQFDSDSKEGAKENDQ